MKRLLFLLLFAPLLAFGQRQVTVTVIPTVNPTAKDSLVLIQGADTVKAYMDATSPTEFDSASVVGKRVSGGGLAYGATVSAYVDSVTIVLSDTIVSADDSVGTLYIDYFTQVQYASGDAMGFQNPLTLPSGVRTSGRFSLQNIWAIDSSDQGANFDILFFSGPITQSTDNSAFSISETDGLNILGYVAVDTWADLGGVDIGYETPNLSLAQGGQYYYQLISKGTATYTSGTPLRIKLVFHTDD